MMRNKIFCIVILSFFIIGIYGNNFVDAKKIEFKFKENLNLKDDEYDLVIITPTDFVDELKPFVNHKNSFEMKSFIKTTDEIYSEFEGFDEPEDIKLFIKNSIELYNIKYVLLIGSIDKLPIRFSAVTCSWYTFDYVPTDLYYADIYDSEEQFSSWDTNGNNIYGEFSWEMSENIVDYPDEVDLYPDVGVGRIPCSNKEDLKVVVNKIIAYETQTYEQDWFKKIILMGGDTHPQYEGFEGEFVTEHIGNLFPDFNKVKLWTSLDRFKPIIINEEVSKGAGFISYSGHGLKNGISTNPPNVDKPIYYFDIYLSGMRNGNKLPIVFFDCCSTGTFDYKKTRTKDFMTYRFTKFDFTNNIIKRILHKLKNNPTPTNYKDCFAWSIVKESNGGAIASLGASRMGYSGYVGAPLGAGTCRMNANFFDAYEPGIHLSEMLMNAQTAYLDDVWKDCFTLEEYNLIGDPSLKVGGYQ